MSQVRELHRHAMQLADEADAARKRGEPDVATRLIRAAYEAEKKAALRLADRSEAEPTRSILLRSAAYLALENGMGTEAGELAERALEGHPPPRVEAELRTLLANIQPSQVPGLGKRRGRRLTPREHLRLGSRIARVEGSSARTKRARRPTWGRVDKRDPGSNLARSS